MLTDTPIFLAAAMSVTASPQMDILSRSASHGFLDDVCTALLADDGHPLQIAGRGADNGDPENHFSLDAVPVMAIC